MNDIVENYKRAMRNLLQPVSILTFQNGSLRLGVTVTSASSYSAEPPIFMAAIHRESTLAGELSLGNSMAMNLLCDGHEGLAKDFAGATGRKGAARFEVGDWEFSQDYAPRLRDALCAFQGHLRALIPQASHAILLVEIDKISEGSGQPLGYYNQDYFGY